MRIMFWLRCSRGIQVRAASENISQPSFEKGAGHWMPSRKSNGPILTFYYFHVEAL
jgi:hypothetical protein